MNDWQVGHCLEGRVYSGLLCCKTVPCQCWSRTRLKIQLSCMHVSEFTELVPAGLGLKILRLWRLCTYDVRSRWYVSGLMNESIDRVGCCSLIGIGIGSTNGLCTTVLCFLTSVPDAGCSECPGSSPCISSDTVAGATQHATVSVSLRLIRTET